MHISKRTSEYEIMTRIRKLVVCVILAALSLVGMAHGQDWKTLLNLKGTWKFELGDDQRWSDPSFDDSKWDNIRVPSPWEDEGYPGYDGYAWYRKHFKVDGNLKSAIVYLHVGCIDDVSEVYLNGHMVGFQGEFPPYFFTAYSVEQQYPIPQEYINYAGDNVIAVRVYDQRLSGGIIRGRIGLFEPRDYLNPDYNLAGIWKFTTGDDESWRRKTADDSRWKNVIVPAFWETQGYRNYDGFGWYRVKFKVPANLVEERLIFLLGRIDDVDEAYLNGELIGKTGRIRKGMGREDVGDEWLRFRAYVVPSNLLIPDGENVIAVRVNDVFLHGGIYDGPIGLVTRDRYLRWKNNQNEGWNPFRWFE